MTLASQLWLCPLCLLFAPLKLYPSRPQLPLSVPCESDQCNPTFHLSFLSALSDDAARISAYDAYTFLTVPTATSGNGKWLRDNGGTASTGTGSTVDHTLGTTSGYYLYFESSGTSGSWPNGAILRSPEITLDGSPTISWESSRYGASMGQTEVWWKET